MRCPNCGTENRPQAHFCHDCGKSLAVAKKTPPPAKPQTNNRAFWIALSGIVALILCGICGLTAWIGWRSHSGSVPQIVESGTPPSWCWRIILKNYLLTQQRQKLMFHLHQGTSGLYMHILENRGSHP